MTGQGGRKSVYHHSTDLSRNSFPGRLAAELSYLVVEALVIAGPAGSLVAFKDHSLFFYAKIGRSLGYQIAQRKSLPYSTPMDRELEIAAERPDDMGIAGKG